MWQDIMGQEQAVSILQRQVARGRVAHAYIFNGPPGVGKKRAAIQLAKSIFCQSHGSGDSCDQCINCHRIENGNHPDLYQVEPEGESIKIAQIRNLQKEFYFSTVESDAKIYIIEAADTMTREAGNSLLKFLEEPAKGVTAILLTTNTNSLLPTIISRCQVITFHPLSWIDIAIEAEQKFGISSGHARVAARIVGNVDQVYQIYQREAFAQLRTLVLKFYEEINQKKSQAIIKLQELVFSDSKIRDEVELFLDVSLVWFRDLLEMKLGRVQSIANIEHIDLLKKEAEKSSLLGISHKIELLHNTYNRLKSMNNQLALEQMILQMEEGKTYV